MYHISLSKAMQSDLHILQIRKQQQNRSGKNVNERKQEIAIVRFFYKFNSKLIRSNG